VTYLTGGADVPPVFCKMQSAVKLSFGHNFTFASNFNIMFLFLSLIRRNQGRLDRQFKCSIGQIIEIL